MDNTESEKVVSVSSRGQATIPKEFREELGIDTPGRVKFVRTEKGDIVVSPIHSVTDLRGVLEGKTDDQRRSVTERLRRNTQRTVSEKQSWSSATSAMKRLTRQRPTTEAVSFRFGSGRTRGVGDRVSTRSPRSTDPTRARARRRRRPPVRTAAPPPATSRRSRSAGSTPRRRAPGARRRSG